MIVTERFHLPEAFKEDLGKAPVPWGFGPLSETVYKRTYARDDEQWADTVSRVVEGVMSIRKDWYVNVVGKGWQESRWQEEARRMAEAIFQMRLLPPGRGLWAMGTEYVYERGSHALNNCGFVAVENSLAVPSRWLMDSLMCGVGVGFGTDKAALKPYKVPTGEPKNYEVPDTREGWAESVKRLIQSYEKGGRPVEFDYSKIRRSGTKINGFGGVSAGPAPLRKLHGLLRKTLNQYAEGRITQTRLIVDTMNAIGACVVSGNVRRSAELAVGAPGDMEFLDLKNYEMYPDRAELGWMSNNSVALSERDHFDMLPELSDRIRDNGEPGILNLINVQKYGRAGERLTDEAVGINPCGEIPLESNELCNLVEVFPTRCGSPEEIYETMRLATLYASTVALLRSHSSVTNTVMARNRRIGVSVSGVADWLDGTSVSNVFGILNRGYEDVVKPTNKGLASEAGVAQSVRCTTVKPSGTVSLLAGVSAGMHFPHDKYVVRRVRVSTDSPVTAALQKAGIPNEPDAVSDNTTVFEFPLQYGNGKTRSVKHVSIYEQAAIVAMLQRCWADNAVSNTLTVQPSEMGQIERVFALFAPQVKSMSLLPDLDEGAFAQMPLERITKSEYTERQSKIKEVKWDSVDGTGEDDSRFCTNDRCEIP